MLRFARRFSHTTTRGNKQSPPSYFTNPADIPNTYTPEPFHRQSSVPESGKTDSKSSHDNIFGHIFNAVTTFGLVYLAVDNHNKRELLEKSNTELTTINLKTLQLQEAQYQAARKKRELQITQERKEVAKRSMKMALHIALLRQQLEDAGIEPKTIDDAMNQFQSSVKIDNSIKNVSSQQLWLDDKSVLKPYLPDYYEYDKRSK